MNSAFWLSCVEWQNVIAPEFFLEKCTVVLLCNRIKLRDVKEPFIVFTPTGDFLTKFSWIFPIS